MTEITTAAGRDLALAPALAGRPVASLATAVSVPDSLLGFALVAAVAMDDQAGLLRQRHIVVLHDVTKADGRAYSTHYAAWQPGYGWALCWGHYELDRDRAMADLVTREARER